MGGGQAGVKKGRGAQRAGWGGPQRQSGRASGGRAARPGTSPQLDGYGGQYRGGITASAAPLRMAPGLQAFRFFCGKGQGERSKGP